MAVSKKKTGRNFVVSVALSAEDDAALRAEAERRNMAISTFGYALWAEFTKDFKDFSGLTGQGGFGSRNVVDLEERRKRYREAGWKPEGV